MRHSKEKFSGPQDVPPELSPEDAAEDWESLIAAGDVPRANNIPFAPGEAVTRKKELEGKSIYHCPHCGKKYTKRKADFNDRDAMRFICPDGDQWTYRRAPRAEERPGRKDDVEGYIELPQGEFDFSGGL